MKKQAILSLVGLAGALALSNHAMAMASQSLEEGTCYVFKQGKLASKEQCEIFSEQGGNSNFPSYGYENYSVKMPKAGVLHVVNSINCHSAKQCTSKHTLNKKKAVSQYRKNTKGYQVVSAKQAENLSYEAQESLLRCDKTTDGKLELCTANKEMVEYGAEAPRWAE